MKLIGTWRRGGHVDQQKTLYLEFKKLNMVAKQNLPTYLDDDLQRQL